VARLLLTKRAREQAQCHDRSGRIGTILDPAGVASQAYRTLLPSQGGHGQSRKAERVRVVSTMRAAPSSMAQVAIQKRSDTQKVSAATNANVIAGSVLV
jgi:hypothetical protein